MGPVVLHRRSVGRLDRDQAVNRGRARAQLQATAFLLFSFVPAWLLAQPQFFEGDYELRQRAVDESILNTTMERSLSGPFLGESSEWDEPEGSIEQLCEANVDPIECSVSWTQLGGIKPVVLRRNATSDGLLWLNSQQSQSGSSVVSISTSGFEFQFPNGVTTVGIEVDLFTEVSRAPGVPNPGSVVVYDNQGAVMGTWDLSTHSDIDRADLGLFVGVLSSTPTGAVLADLTVQNGFAYQGGGIRNSGYLALNRVEVKDNLAYEEGGGVSSEGSFYARGTIVRGNRVSATNPGPQVRTVASRGWRSLPDQFQFSLC